MPSIRRMVGVKSMFRSFCFFSVRLMDLVRTQTDTSLHVQYMNDQFDQQN